MPEKHRLGLVLGLAIWAAVSLFVANRGIQLGYAGPGFAVAVAVFMLLFSGQVLPAVGNVLEVVRRPPVRRASTAYPLGPVAAYLSYVAGTAFLGWRFVALGVLYAIAPSALARYGRGASPGKWQDYAAVLAIWLPVELGWLYRLWPYPRELTHILTILFALNTALAAFLIVRRLDGVGYAVEWGRGFWRVVGVNFLVFAAIVVPLGEAIGFLTFDPSVSRLRSLPTTALGIVFFTAWPEEFLFRGLLQNMFARTLQSSTAGLLTASVVFGLAHINNGGFPNWRYVLLATIAGIFYGRAWLQAGTIFAPALVHALVDVSWHLLFH